MDTRYRMGVIKSCSVLFYRLSQASEATRVLQKIMIKQSFFKNEGHNHLIPFLIISSLFFMCGFAHGFIEVLNPHFQESFHICKTMSVLSRLQFMEPTS